MAHRPCGPAGRDYRDLRWSADGAALIGQDRRCRARQRHHQRGGAFAPGRRRRPAVTTPDGARRRLFRVETGDGGVAEVGPRDRTVWEYDLLGSDAARSLLASTDFQRARLVSRRHLPHRLRRPVRCGYSIESPRQMQSVVVSLSGRRLRRRLASDRGLVGGEMRVLDIATGKVTSLAAGEQSSVTSLAWRDEESLWFTGWSGLGTVYGVVRLDGAIASWSTARTP